MESKVNRLLVKRMTVAQAWNEMTLSLVAGFFLTTFPTNMSLGTPRHGPITM